MKDNGSAIAQVVTSDPVGEWHEIMQGLMKAVCSARHYFYVETPYFLPTEEVMTALQIAALGGVDVRIMLPKRADTFITHKGSLSYLDELMKAGVKVYLYKKGFCILSCGFLMTNLLQLDRRIWISAVLSITLKPMSFL